MKDTLKEQTETKALLTVKKRLSIERTSELSDYLSYSSGEDEIVTRSRKSKQNANKFEPPDNVFLNAPVGHQEFSNSQKRCGTSDVT